MPRPVVLVIAGSDSSGGAGLVRDVRTLERVGADAVCAVTAVTAQTHTGLIGTQPVAPQHVRAQIAAALDSRPVGAVKIGMLGTAAVIEAVAEALEAHRCTAPVVLDPVLNASSGGALLDGAGLRALQARLFPLAMLVTPNLPEAAALAGGADGASTVSGPRGRVVEWAHAILEQGPQAVLVKGGHSGGTEAADVLVRAQQPPLWLTGPRLDAHMRGTGCALASAIAAALASGADLAQACRRGRAHVRALLGALCAPAGTC